MSNEVNESAPIPFKAETRQILDILIHSLYTEREIFLRELISNASDALTRMDFEMLTHRDILNPEMELGIWITTDQQNKTISISDTGIGMTAEEMIENLGIIAHSGARAFIRAAQESSPPGTPRLSDLIGQFGVGFYSVFMVAESVTVTSQCYRPDTRPAMWFCTGADTYTIKTAQKDTRGTTIVVKLKEDASEFAQEYRLREIIKKHSDFIPYSIYLGESKEQVNQRNAIWRQPPQQIQQKDYEDFYKQLTLDIEPPLTYTHLSFDAPVQMYAILYVPANPEHHLFSLRKEDGLKLYARKVLIQEYCKELLPEYFRFVQGVVDSEDLPLNVSRESIQSTRIMAQLKRLITNKVISMLESLASENPGKYKSFWSQCNRYIKQGVAIETSEPEGLYSLLRFHTTLQQEELSSLSDYCQRMQPDQSTIYYILGDDDRSVVHSPHLDIVRKHAFEVLLMTDPVDPFMLARLKKYQDHDLVNVAKADLKLPSQPEEKLVDEIPSVPVQDWVSLVNRFKTILGERVADVRITDRLADSPARLIDPEGAPAQELQRVYRWLNEKFEIPKKVLELNPRHPIMVKLNTHLADDDLTKMVVEQIFENALLIEGLHQDPASMIARIHKLIESAL